MSHPFYAAHPGNNGGNNGGAGGGNNNGQHHPLAAQGIQGHPALGGSGLGGLGANSPGSTTSTMRMGITTYYRTMSIDNKVTTIIIGPNGEPIKLPESLESLPKSDQFPGQRHRWNTNEEIASMLIAFDRHIEWLSKEVKIRPKSGSMLLYSRKKVRYRRDGYCWKKRKDGKTTREDHMKLKVQGMECIYGCYVHSAILPTFHRRCYWLLQNPDIVLVHYLNVPYPDDNKLIVSSNVSLWGEKKEWTKDELISQLKPMFFSEEEPDLNNELEISTAETVNSIVNQLMEKQRAARAESLSKKAPECSCPDSTNPDKPCPHYCNNTGGNGNNKTGGVPTDVSGSPRRSRSGRNMNRLNAGGLAAQHKRAQQTTQQPQPQQPRQQTNNNNNNAQGNNQNQYYKATEPAYYASYGHVSSTSDFEQQQQHHHQAAHHHRKQQQQVAAAAAAAQQQQVVVGPSHPGVKDSNSSKKSGSDLLHHHSLQPQGALHSHHLLLGSHSSPVASAVRTLSHLSDFGLNGAGSEGGYEPYFMSAESLLPEPIKTEEKPLLTPLLDFKSAFSDLEGGSIKSSELSFNEALDFEGPGSNSSGSSIGRVLPESPYTPHHTQVLVKDLQCSSSSSNHVSGGSSSSASSASSSSAAAAAAAAAHYPPHEGCFEPSHLGAPGIDSSFDILKDFSSDFGSYELGSSSSLGHPSRHHPVLLGGIKQQQQPQPQNQQQTQQQHPHPSNTAATSSSYENTCCFNWNFNNNNAMDRGSGCYSCRKREASTPPDGPLPHKLRSFEEGHEGSSSGGGGDYLVPGGGELQINDVISPSFYIWHNQQAVGH